MWWAQEEEWKMESKRKVYVDGWIDGQWEVELEDDEQNIDNGYRICRTMVKAKDREKRIGFQKMDIKVDGEWRVEGGGWDKARNLDYLVRSCILFNCSSFVLCSVSTRVTISLSKCMYCLNCK